MHVVSHNCKNERVHVGFETWLLLDVCVGGRGGGGEVRSRLVNHTSSVIQFRCTVYL